jgi:hypothetical protein
VTAWRVKYLDRKTSEWQTAGIVAGVETEAEAIKIANQREHNVTSFKWKAVQIPVRSGL